MAKTSVSDWDTTAGNNTDIDGVDLTGATGRVKDGDNYSRSIMAQVASYTRHGADLATAATLNLDSVDNMFVNLTGTTTVTAVTLTATHSRRARAVSAFQLTASASLVVNGSTSTNYTTTAGDLLFFEGYSSSVVRVWIVSGGSSDAGWQNVNQPINLSLAASVGSNALTIAIKGHDGNDPSSSNKVYIPFRSATAGSGDMDVLSLSSATSLVITSGSTLGAPTGSVPFKVWVVGFNDGGTFRLGAIVCTTLASGVLTQRALSAWGIASSLAEGGAGAADAAQTFYTGTAVTSKAFTVLGVLSYESGLATAGTWAAAPTRVQVYDSSVPLPGQIVQRQRTQTGAFSSGSTTAPYDDTIMQNTEGNEFLSDAITPISKANLLQIDMQMFLQNSAAQRFAMGLFQDTTADALATIGVENPSADRAVSPSLQHVMIAATDVSTTFKGRAGGNGAGTTYFNGNSVPGRLYGGVLSSFISIIEVAA